MKLSKRHIKELTARILKSYILEAEEEKASDDAEGGDENPFAAAGGDEGGEEAAGGEEGGEEKGAEKKAEQPAGIPLKFDISKVKKYNDANFLSDTGTVKSIDKRGIVVTTQPDGVDVLVNFDDISESVKQFFKKQK